MGGLAIFLGFILQRRLFVDISRQVQGILLGAVLIAACGIDDIISLRAWIKLIVQIVAAIVAVAYGVVIEVLMDPIIFSETRPSSSACSPYRNHPWIVGITNSVNLIDGLDGLAVGVSTISSVTMFVVALLARRGGQRRRHLAALAGACLGSCPTTSNPAKIFMGDTGRCSWAMCSRRSLS